jgi:methylated-DNA-[protein]-cysteine S-methyltransferase
MYYDIFDTSMGDMIIAGDDAGIRRVAFDKMAEARRHLEKNALRDPQRTAETREQLRAYFAGRLRDFELPLAPEGTPFQQRVWRALLTIPYGETTSYGVLAKALGKPNGARAVGSANGKNPIALVIPCHRVIGHDGQLTGYAYGVDTKRELLALERRHTSGASGASSDATRLEMAAASL